MSFENTPEQATPAEVAATPKKRGRPAGVKSSNAKKPATKVSASVKKLTDDLQYANLHIKNLEENITKLRRHYKTEVDGLMAIVSYLECTLKKAWQEESLEDDSSV
jgi:hypothetical protein